MYNWVGKVLSIDLTSEKITEIPSSNYFPKYLGGRGLVSKILWDDVPSDTKALDPENRLIFAPGALTGTISPTNGRSVVGALAPQHPKEFPSFSNMGGHWGSELKFAGYDGLVISGKASKPVYILIRDKEIEIRNARFLWGKDAILTQKMIQNDLAKEGKAAPDINNWINGDYDPRQVRSERDIHIPNMGEKSQAGRYDPKRIRSIVIGPAGEKLSRIAILLHDSGDAAGQGGFGGVMGSKNLKAISIRGTGKVHIAKPKEMIELVYKVRLMIRKKAFPIVPPYGGPGGIYGGDTKFLTAHMKRSDGCFACQIACRAYIAPPGMTPGQQQCVSLQMYYNWEGIGPVAPPHPDFADRLQDETTWHGVRLADELGINSYELTGILSWLWAGYKEGIFTEANTGIPIQDMGSKVFADKLFGMIANREGEFGELLSDGLHRTSQKLKDKFGNRVWELYEERYVAHGQRQHWFYIGSPKGPADPTGFPNPIGQLLWATGCRDPYSNTSKNRETYGDPELCEFVYGNKEAANPFTYEGKAVAAVVAQHNSVQIDSLGFCDWFFPIQRPPNLFAEDERTRELGDLTLESQLFSMASGIDTSYEEMMKMSERVFNVERAVQVRMGRRRDDDTFNDYFFTNPDRRGNPIDIVSWEKLKDEYYEIRGWDNKSGVPTSEKLNELDLKDVADELVF